MANPGSTEGHQLKKILITGGCGFIGTNLVKYLADKGYQIRILDNLSTGREENLRQLQSQGSRPLMINLTIGDIRNRDEVNQAVKGTDAVVHLAAHTNVVESLEKPEEDWGINVNGTLNLLEACRQNRVTRFVLASSNAVVGEQPPPIDESKIPRPLSPYGASKLAGEAFSSCYYHSFGLETVSLRFSNCYGPFSEQKPSVIPRFITWAKEGKPLIIYGDGNQTRDFVHAADICQAIYLALTAPQPTKTTPGSQPLIDEPQPSAIDLYGGVFQIGTGIETSINELVESIKEMAGGKPRVIYQPERKGEIKRNYSDITKARRVLGFKPSIKFRDGLKELWELPTTKSTP
ncbi:UDP-glucose 4-epimerase [subsurface metagenome]